MPAVRLPFKALVLAFAFLVVAAFVIAGSGRASATQNRPTWNTGDFWYYQNSDGDAIRIEVRERATLTLTGGPYQVWHTIQMFVPSGGGPNVTTHVWMQDSDLGIAKLNLSFGAFGVVEVTYDPPLVQAVFPLDAGDTWSGQSTLNVVGTSFNLQVPYSGRVLPEADTTVPAGTFRVAQVRSPSANDPYTVSFYSEAVGNAVRVESYDGSGALVDTQVLTSSRYQAGSNLLLLILAGVIGFIILVLAVVTITRRRRMPPGVIQPPYQPPQPRMTPDQPPQGPPPGL